METILSVCERCVTAINDAARQGYRDGDTSHYDGCSAEVCLSPDTQIYVCHDPQSGFSVEASHPSNQETPNLDEAVIAYLEDNADPETEWQEAYDNDCHGCQATLDAGFGSWQDYYDYMYN